MFFLAGNQLYDWHCHRRGFWSGGGKKTFPSLHRASAFVIEGYFRLKSGEKKSLQSFFCFLQSVFSPYLAKNWVLLQSLFKASKSFFIIISTVSPQNPQLAELRAFLGSTSVKQKKMPPLQCMQSPPNPQLAELSAFLRLVLFSVARPTSGSKSFVHVCLPPWLNWLRGLRLTTHPHLGWTCVILSQKCIL